jgi:adenylate cyclase
LSARIDRLSPPEKSMLQTASVLAEEFPRSLLARIARIADPALDEALGSLVSAQFLSARPVRGEAAYALRHPLTQEVAYGSMLSDRRATLHAACARAMSEHWLDRRDERAAVMARHWEAAGEWLEGARCHARAAAWLGKRDPRGSIRHWESVQTQRRLSDSASLRAACGCSSAGGSGSRLRARRRCLKRPSKWPCKQATFIPRPSSSPCTA